MVYNFNDFKNKLEEKTKWLSSELSTFRTGKATPAILDKIMVESYGSMMPISHVASISIDDPRTLKIVPWDKTIVISIEKAIVYSNLGLSVSVDGQGVRVSFPELTSERREAMTKIAKEKLEEARISLRHERDVIWDDIQEKERGGEISEDEKFRYKDALQKIVDEYNGKLESLYSKKERELGE